MKRDLRYMHFFEFQECIDCDVPQGLFLGPLFFLQYIYDLLHACLSDTFLFANDTYLMLADIQPSVSQHRVTEELSKIDIWLRKSKLFLNFSKTCYMLINKQPHKPCSFDLRLPVRSSTLKRENSKTSRIVY